MQLGSCDPVGDDDALLGGQGLGDVGQEFVLVVLVRLRRFEDHAVRPDEAVVSEGELAGEFLAHLQVGQVDG